MEQKYLQKLGDSGLSNTRPRRAVFDALLKNDHNPMTINELVTYCQKKADRSSVYRAVETLEKINVIHKIHTGWKYKLELSDEFHGHHHHMICRKCHKIIVFKDTGAIESELKNSARHAEFAVSDHSLEIYGTCKSCQKNGTPG